MSADPVFWLLLCLTVYRAVSFFWTAYRRGERSQTVLWDGSTLTCVCLLLAHSIRADSHSFTLAGIVVMLVSVVVSMTLKARHEKYLTRGMPLPMRVRRHRIVSNKTTAMVFCGFSLVSLAHAHAPETIGVFDHGSGVKDYWSPARSLRAQVVYRTPRGYGEAESVVQILSASGRRLALRDYSSSGGGNGQTVVRGAWTADTRFFVFSTESSGGHSPWHNPAHVYSRRRRWFFCLDRFVDPITTPAFRLIPPASVHTHTLWQGGVTVDLHRIERKLTAASEEAAPISHRNRPEPPT